MGLLANDFRKTSCENAKWPFTEKPTLVDDAGDGWRLRTRWARMWAEQLETEMVFQGKADA